jgi:CRP-like cAMP-binding protein
LAGPTPIGSTTDPAAGAEPTRAFVSLLDVDPDLAEGIPDHDEALARRALARPVQALTGPVIDVEALVATEGVLGLLIVGGALLRELDLGGRVCTEILGPGDVVGAAPAAGMLAVPVAWRMLRPVTVIVLDARFTAAAQRWPSLALNLHRRLLDQAHRSAVHAAVAQLPRVERRVLALLWQLAERWGRVTPFGVEVDLALTHEAIGRLIGAQRPTVSLALTDLAREEAVTRTPRRTWLLSSRSRDDVRPPRAATPTA